MNQSKASGYASAELGEILSLQYGSALPERARKPGTVPVFGSNGQVGFHSASLVEGPGIIVGRKGSGGSVVWSDSSFWAIDTTYYAESKDGSCLKWLYYLLCYAQLDKLNSTSGVPGLNRNDVYEAIVPVPPHAAQKKIAIILSSMDALLEHTQAVIEQAQTVKRRLVQQLVVCGLPSRHREFKRVERRWKVPADWDIKPLSSCSVIQTGLAKGKRYTSERKVVSMAYLRVANVQDSYFDLSDVKTIDVAADEVERYSLKYGDVLLTEGGDADKLGRGYIWRDEVSPCLHQNHVFAVRVDQMVLEPTYFSYLVSSDYGKAYFLNCAKQTTNLASINSTQLKAFSCLVPSLSEQRHISSILHSVDERIAKELEKKGQLATIKKGLMQQLLTGRLPVKV